MIVLENVKAPYDAKYFEITFKGGERIETHIGTIEGQTFEVFEELKKAKEDLKRLSKREHNLFIERETLKKDNKELQEKYEALKEEFKTLEKANEHLEGKLEMLKDLIRDTILNGGI